MESTASSAQERIIRACTKGDIPLLQTLLPETPSSDLPSPNDMLAAAAATGNATTVQYLLEKYPALELNDKVLISAIEGGLGVYKVLYAKDPSIIVRELGHMGHTLSLVALKNDVPFLQFLLQNGANVEQSRFFYQPLMDVARQKASGEVIRLLEGQGKLGEEDN